MKNLGYITLTLHNFTIMNEVTKLHIILDIYFMNNK